MVRHIRTQNGMKNKRSKCGCAQFIYFDIVSFIIYDQVYGCATTEFIYEVKKESLVQHLESLTLFKCQ